MEWLYQEEVIMSLACLVMQLMHFCKLQKVIEPTKRKENWLSSVFLHLSLKMSSSSLPNTHSTLFYIGLELLETSVIANIQ